MTIDSLKDSLSTTISQSPIGAEFYFLLGRDGDLKVKRANIEKATEIELCQHLISEISDTILLKEGISLLELSNADERSNVIYKYDLEDLPQQLEHMSAAIESKSHESFNFSEDKLEDIKAIIAIIGTATNNIAIYKHQYPVSLLKKESFSIFKSNDGKMFEKLDRDVLKINSSFDFLRSGENYYIKNLSTLEKFFGFHEVIKNSAIAGIERISESGILVDTAVLSARVSDISFSRKLVKSGKSSRVIGTVPPSQIISFVSNHPALRGKFRLSPDGSKIELDTKVSQNLFVKLINDDFLHSQLTSRHYESLAKDDI